MGQTRFDARREETILYLIDKQKELISFLAAS